MTHWSLRLAKPADAEHMPAIEAAAATLFDTVEGLPQIGRDTIPVETLQRYIRKGHCLVAFVGDDMAGFLVSEPFGRELHIRELSVDPAFQKRGIGAGLLRACMIDAHNSGFRALTLTTFRDVPWNGPFYASRGFEEVADLDAHPRLAEELANDEAAELPKETRIAMIHFLS